MAGKGFIENIKNINALITFGGSVITGGGILATTALLIAKHFGLPIDPETTTKVLLAVVLLQAVAWIAYLVIAFSVRKLRKREALGDAQFRVAVQKLIPIWSALARLSAEVDSRIFEYLFLDRLADQAGEKPAYDLACDQIKKILDQSARAFKILTNDDCAFTIKCAIVKSDSLQTLHRDTRSAEIRGARDVRIESLRANKPMEAIARLQMSHYVEDDLQAAANRQEYTNSRPDWKLYYNATLVYPIEIHATVRRPGSPGLPANRIFMICVDNKKGGFNTDVCLESIRYLANRVSALLYRGEILKNLISK